MKLCWEGGEKDLGGDQERQTIQAKYMKTKLERAASGAEEAGEMAQQVEHLVASVGDPGLIPNSHRVVHSHVKMTAAPGIHNLF